MECQWSVCCGVSVGCISGVCGVSMWSVSGVSGLHDDSEESLEYARCWMCAVGCDSRGVL